MACVRTVPDMQTHLAALIRMRQRLTDGTAKQLRIEHGLARTEVAATIGVTYQALQKWELGTRRPRGEHAVAYARLLDKLAAIERQPPGPPAERVSPLEHDAPALPRPDGRHRRTSDSSASEAVR